MNIKCGRKFVKYSITIDLLSVLFTLILAFLLAFISGCSSSEPIYTYTRVIGFTTDNGNTIYTGILNGAVTDITGIIIGDGSNISGSNEIDDITLDNSIAKGTWTNSGTWTVPPFTLSGTIALNGKHFNAGSTDLIVDTTGPAKGLQVYNTQDEAGGVRWVGYHNSASPAINDSPMDIIAYGKNSTGSFVPYAQVQYKILEYTSGNETGYFLWRGYYHGAYNDAMKLTMDGTLYIDDGYDTFDDYDDAILLKRSFSDGEKDALKDLDILVTHIDEYGKEKYMINTQKLISLIAGGVYQNRDYIEGLERRIDALEKDK